MIKEDMPADVPPTTMLKIASDSKYPTEEGEFPEFLEELAVRAFMFIYSFL